MKLLKRLSKTQIKKIVLIGSIFFVPIVWVGLYVGCDYRLSWRQNISMICIWMFAMMFGIGLSFIKH